MRASAQTASQLDGETNAGVERELKEFSYIVSHDLAASFRHLAGFSQLLLGDLGESLTPRQQRHADHIRAAADKCLAMMEQLLVFSRVQQATLLRVRRDATPAMQLTLLHLADEIRDADAEISLEPLGEVYADQDMLALAFRCLLDNSIKFRQPGIAPRITVRAMCDRTCWRLRVADNGCGVESAGRERAFRMFLRLNSEEAYPGVGAGLAICRRIARRHGGEATFLDCASGACVELTLPFPAAATMPTRPTSKEGG
jgi:light-regulated signal transduction histidine kinase (bacteriophytochrome)